MPEGTALSVQTQVNDIVWGEDALPLRFRVRADGVVGLVGLGPLASPTGPGLPPADPGLPLVEVQLTGSGSNWSGERIVESATGARLVYRGHEVIREGAWRHLCFDLADPATGLEAEVHYRALVGVPAVRCWTRLVNQGTRRLVVEAVTSLVLPGLGGTASGVRTDPASAEEAPGHDPLGGLDLHWADSDWLAEGRWQTRPLRSLLVDLNRTAHEHGPRGCFARSSQGSWSSGRYLPMGALTWHAGTGALAWQIESSGGWRWEVGEHDSGGYLALLGPHDREHHWRRPLAPGEDFTTVTAALALGAASNTGSDGFTEAVAALTRYRRAIRRPHPDHATLPVVFNDYMNTLMGDPTTARLLPLIDAAAEAGAEYFVIDAGWYDDDAEGWWDSVGEWQESASRFPGGLAEVCDHIRRAGMTPGLWLEPEVVGVRSRVAEQLPPEAFFQRDGIRVLEHGRYHLDFRHPAARAHLDGVVDRLVADYGVGYLKLDYNINSGPGTDTDGSPGAGLLGHQRAFADWLADILDRHPRLTLENCASGGMRADYALLSLLQLQSTSDQQDHLRYPPIAAAAPAAITPEQSAVWAYPQPQFTDEEISFSVAGALLGRVHLSGRLDLMTPHQRELVAEGVRAYKRIRQGIPAATPFWPLGLPGWNDDWLCLGLRAPDATHLLLWRRGGPAHTELVPPGGLGTQAAPHVLYPTHGSVGLSWDASAARLRVHHPEAPAACLITFDDRT